ncbi:MAG: hypothetical protein IT427_16210 [Pirellulales bacterium]|nr:hypothetical protein [Pirellulales bacterium]
MSKAAGQVVGTDPKVEGFFKDANGDLMLRKDLPLTTTLREVRKANPFGPSNLWIDFHLPKTGRLERVELFSMLRPRGAILEYHMNIDDINHLSGDNESFDRFIYMVESVIWNWSERIKVALGTDDFAVNWEGPNRKRVQADGSVRYYMTGQFAYFRFIREHKSRKALDAITLNELSSRGSVLCDLLEKISEEIRNCHSDSEFCKRTRHE